MAGWLVVKIPSPPSRVLVLGYGITGKAVLPHLVREGYKVLLSDSRKDLASQIEVQEWMRKDVECIFGAQHPELLKDVDWVLTSPGIPPTNPVLQGAESVNVPVISDIDYVLSHWNTPPFSIVAVTGTEGKSTVTSWIFHLLRKAGKSAEALGNIGSPISELLTYPQLPDWVVLEVSSFQLSRTVSLKPDIAVLLNIQPDHLDWHSSFEGYCEAKMRIFQNQSWENWAVVNGEDEEIQKRKERICSRISTFSLSVSSDTVEGTQAYLNGKALVLKTNAEQTILVEDVRKLPAVPGRIYVRNALASVLAAHLARVEKPALVEGLKDFRLLPHRMEFLGITDGGFAVFNDSKATTPFSALAAIQSLTDPDFYSARPVTVILGGAEKNLSYRELLKEMGKRCHAVVLTGRISRLFFELALSEFPETGRPLLIVEEDFDLAVQKACAVTPSGGVLLLSPACTSYDRFRNFEERGDRFRELLAQHLVSQ